jgi:hypothetical protein
MSTYNTAALIEDLQQQTETFLQEAISRWQVTDAALLGKQPAAGAWSAAQCLAHLNSYGDYYLPEIKKAIQLAQQKKYTAQPQFSSGWLGAYFTKLMLPDAQGRAKKKMQSPKDHRPLPDVDAHEAVSTFIMQQEILLQLLEQARNINIGAIRIPISVARFIRLKLGDVLLFIVAHNQRHVAQAKRAMQQVHALQY